MLGHAHLFSVIPVLAYVLPERTPFPFLESSWGCGPWPWLLRAIGGLATGLCSLWWHLPSTASLPPGREMCPWGGQERCLQRACHPEEWVLSLGSVCFIVPWPQGWPVALECPFPKISGMDYKSVWFLSCCQWDGDIVSIHQLWGLSPWVQSHDPLTARQCLRASASVTPFSNNEMALVGAPSPIFLLMRKKAMPGDTKDFPNPMKQIGIRTDLGD